MRLFCCLPFVICLICFFIDLAQVLKPNRTCIVNTFFPLPFIRFEDSWIRTPRQLHEAGTAFSSDFLKTMFWILLGAIRFFEHPTFRLKITGLLGRSRFPRDVWCNKQRKLCLSLNPKSKETGERQKEAFFLGVGDAEDVNQNWIGELSKVCVPVF